MLSNNSIWVIIGKIVWLDYYYQRLSTYLFIYFTVEIEILFWLANLNFIWNYVDKLIQEGLVSSLIDPGINRYFRWILDFNGFFFVSVKVNPAERKQRFNFDFQMGSVLMDFRGKSIRTESIYGKRKQARSECTFCILNRCTADRKQFRSIVISGTSRECAGDMICFSSK